MIDDDDLNVMLMKMIRRLRMDLRRVKRAEEILRQIVEQAAEPKAEPEPITEEAAERIAERTLKKFRRKAIPPKPEYNAAADEEKLDLAVRNAVEKINAGESLPWTELRRYIMLRPCDWALFQRLDGGAHEDCIG